MAHSLLRDPTLAVAVAAAAAAALLLVLLYAAWRPKPAKSKPLHISEIYVYPIKSLRPTKLRSAVATSHGFQNDRVFMLLQVLPDGHKNMAVSSYPEMTQFLTDIEDRNDGKPVVHVTFRAFGAEHKSKTLTIPLAPDTEKLPPFNVNMHGSPTAAFKMPSDYNAWFSDCFGYQVVLVYLGDNKREVLWTDMVHTRTASRLARLPLLGSAFPQTPRITFADCAPYLVVSSASLDNVSSRLGPDEPMDVTKFRPNIVLSGADQAWEEDYWSKVRIGTTHLTMKHNCVRCASLNIDYETGKPGTGVAGQVLKKLQKDRRIDKGAKWSPVFGRYAFWGGPSNPQVFNVGDEALVIDRNRHLTVFNWPGVG